MTKGPEHSRPRLLPSSRERNSSVAATYPGRGEATQAGAVERSHSILVCRQTSVQSALKSSIHLHHTHPYPPIIGAVESPIPFSQILSHHIGSPPQTPKIPPPTHRRVPLTHAPDHTPSRQGHEATTYEKRGQEGQTGKEKSQASYCVSVSIRR